MVDITKHTLVPKYTILSQEERDKVLKKYNIILKQLPKAMKNDPVVKIIKANVGDVLKIVRKSPTAKESVYYRVVSDA